MKQFQILKLEPSADPARWTFYAHGAALDEIPASHVRNALKGRGCRVRLIPIPKG